VRHHNHSTTDHIKGKNGTLNEKARYRGAAHLTYNLKSARQLTVIMHNFSGFDSKLVLEGCQKAGITNINILAKSSEKILSMTINNRVKFIDSHMHLTHSLATIANTLRKSEGLEGFHCTKQMLGDRPSEDYELVLSKQSFPYEYCNPDTIDIPNLCLPPKEVLFSSLKNKNILDEEYSHAQKVYTRFNCKSLRDYLEIYLYRKHSLKTLWIGTSMLGLKQNVPVENKH